MNKINKNMFLCVFPTNTPPTPPSVCLCLSEQLPCCFQSWPLEGARRYRSRPSHLQKWTLELPEKRGCLGFVSNFTRFQTLETVLMI